MALANSGCISHPGTRARQVESENIAAALFRYGKYDCAESHGIGHDLVAGHTSRGGSTKQSRLQPIDRGDVLIAKAACYELRILAEDGFDHW